MKKCRHCGTIKPLTEYAKHKGHKDGLNATCKPCRKAKYPATDKQKQKAYERQLKRLYGISIDDYNSMYEQQKGLCAGCYQHQTERFCVDHCHETGKVRGLLCASCNKALGLIKDKTSTLVNLIHYLQNGYS
jgi:hypothetical protein